MGILTVVFGILSGCLLSVLVGIIGSSRRIGFGWAFLISLIFTPLVGLIVALLTDPLPGGDRTLRIFGFLDAGYAWGYEGFVNANGHADYRRQEFSMSDLRYSTGIGVAWISPLGPLKFSLAFPLNVKEGDKTQRFQFQIGTGF